MASCKNLTEFKPEFVELIRDTSEVTDLRALVTGKKANRILGYEGEWTGKVVGTDRETEAQVGVAVYDKSYALTGEAKCRATQLLHFLKGKR